MFSRKSLNTDNPTASSTEKEWRLIERVVMANTAELRRSRRWGIFFKLLTFIYLFVAVGYVWSLQSTEATPKATGGHTAVIDVNGVIAAGEMASADIIASGLRRALSHPDTKAVILRINSPGGSPVQSSYIYNEIVRLRELHPEVSVYSVITDTGASGAYYIAAATEEIYANSSSIVGSIGVTAVGFGFEGLIEKVGVERRQYTSGEHKAFLDPFLPIKPEEKALFEATLNDVHQQFIADVKAGRGDRLADNDKLFSGLFWSGRQALDLGLVDGLSSTGELVRELGYPDIVDFSFRRSPLDQFTRDLGLSIAKGLSNISLSQNFRLE